MQQTNLVAPNCREVLETIVKEVAFQFTTQRSQLFFNSIKESIMNPDYFDYQDTPFWLRHPEGRFVFKALFNACRRHLDLSSGDLQAGVSPKAMVNRIKNDVTEHLLLEIESITCSIDIDHIIALSGEVYESANASNLQFAVFPDVPEQLLKDPLAIQFTEAMEFTLTNLHAIRKQLNFSANSMLAVCYENSQFWVKGVLAPKDKEHFPYFKFDKHLTWSFFLPAPVHRNTDLLLRWPIPYQNGSLMYSALGLSFEAHPPYIDFRKHLTWSPFPPVQFFRKKEKMAQCLFRYQQGSLMFPILDLSAEIQEIIEQVLPDGMKSSSILDNIIQMISMTNQCKHGAVLILAEANTIKKEVRRLVTQGKRGTQFDVPKNILAKENSDFLRIFADIDGAIFADFNGNCHACGIILDGEYDSATCHHGDRGRGSRFNSTQLYIDTHQESFAPIIGIAKSEDGMLDIFPPPAN